MRYSAAAAIKFFSFYFCICFGLVYFNAGIKRFADWNFALAVRMRRVYMRERFNALFFSSFAVVKAMKRFCQFWWQRENSFFNPIPPPPNTPTEVGLRVLKLVSKLNFYSCTRMRSQKLSTGSSEKVLRE